MKQLYEKISGYTRREGVTRGETRREEVTREAVTREETVRAIVPAAAVQTLPTYYSVTQAKMELWGKTGKRGKGR